MPPPDTLAPSPEISTPAVAQDAAQAPPTPSRAYRHPLPWIILLMVLACGLLIDLGSKQWAFDNVAGRKVVLDRDELLANPEWAPPPHRAVHVLPWDLLDFQLVINRGAVFGIGENQRGFFIAFTVAALAMGLYVFGRLTLRHHGVAHAAIGMILAGGIGNLHDRIVFSVVRDFMHLLSAHHLPFAWRWPGGSPELFPWVFNAADVMLLAGMGLLMLHMSRLERHKLHHSAATKPLVA